MLCLSDLNIKSTNLNGRVLITYRKNVCIREKRKKNENNITLNLWTVQVYREHFKPEYTTIWLAKKAI